MSIASREEILAWLADPVTKAVGEELKTRLEHYRRALPGHVIEGNHDKARAGAGMISAYEEFIAEFFLEPAAKKETEPETPYRDPAELPGKEK